MSGNEKTEKNTQVKNKIYEILLKTHTEDYDLFRAVDKIYNLLQED